LAAGANFIFYFGTTFSETIGIGDPFRISVILATGTPAIPYFAMYNSHHLVNTVSTPIAFWTIGKFG
jgi:MFS transporter, SP family, sugar:H+ symporter